MTSSSSSGFSKIDESVYFLIAYPATGITINFLPRESNVSYLKTGREKWKGLYIGNEIFKEIIFLLKVHLFFLFSFSSINSLILSNYNNWCVEKLLGF